MNELYDADARYYKFAEVHTNHKNMAYRLLSKRMCRNNKRVLPKPWLMEWLEVARSRKYLLYYGFVKSLTEQNKTVDEKMRKFCEKIL